MLPLQTKLLADAALQCAQADEPLELNPIRRHALAFAAAQGCDLETAALRVFSNAEGAYGSNVNQLVDSSAFEDDGDLAEAYQARKSFAYGTDGEASQQSALLQDTLRNVELAYQNLESVELGVTTVDHFARESFFNLSLSCDYCLLVAPEFDDIAATPGQKA